MLHIPENAESNEYEIEIKVYDENIITTTKDTVIVEGIEKEENVEVLSTETTKDVELGSTETYKIEIINPSDEEKTITVSTSSPLEDKGIKIKVTPEVITVPPESSQEVELQVETSKSTKEGSYEIPIEIASEEEGVIKQVGITAHVVKSKTTGAFNKPLFTSAVVLAIILIVLLIVLFITVRKPSSLPEEETAYY